MKKHSFFATLFLLLPILFSSQTVSAADELSDRVSRLERKLDGKVLIEIVNDIEAIRRELQEIRGEMEQQNHSVEQMEKRQQNIFEDLDSRLQTLEGGGTDQGDIDQESEDDYANTDDQVNENSDEDDGFIATQDTKDKSNDAIENANAIVPVDSFSGGTDGGTDNATNEQPGNQDQVIVLSSGDEEASYSEAFNMLKEGDHQRSIKHFKAFIKQFPASNYADNAQYWMGEAYYARRQFEAAVKEYKKLLKVYPDSGKASHALLKIGYSYDELEETDLAEGELEDLIARYPGTSAASLAQQRLDHIRTE